MARTFGGSDYIDIASDVLLNGPIYTVAFWMKTSTGGQWEVVSRHDAFQSQNGFGFSGSGGAPNRMQFYQKTGSTTYATADASANISDGNWHSVVGRGNRNAGGAIDLMVDGISATPASNTSAGSYNSVPMRIGRSTDTFWANFTGDLGDFAYWNARLSDEECAAFCKGETPGSIRPGALLLWLPMRT